MEKSKTNKKVVTKKNTTKKVVKNNNVSKTKKKINNLLENKSYKLAEKNYKNKDYEKAYKEYLNLCEVFPKNKKIYKRLIECLTKDYSYKENTKEFKVALDDYITTYKILATKKELKYFENKLIEYKQVRVSGSKSRFLLIALLGFTGIHKFLDKKIVKGLIYLFTLGIFGIGVIVDLINDYAEYEDDIQLNIVRYLVSLIIFILGIHRMDTNNYYYFILIAIILTPFVYSNLLRFIPGIIKFIAIIILCYFGFKVTPVIDYVPSKIIGTWVTENENTNFKSIKIKLENSSIEFNDRDKETGKNEYDSTNGVLKVYVNATNSYKFRIDLENEEICTYNDSKKCIISFKKESVDK